MNWKKITPLVLLSLSLLMHTTSFSQNIYSVDAEYKSDLTVFVVDAKYKADLLVYKADAEYQAG